MILGWDLQIWKRIEIGLLDWISCTKLYQKFFWWRFARFLSENDGGKWVRSSLCDACWLVSPYLWMVWWLWYFCNKNTKNKQLNSNKPPPRCPFARPPPAFHEMTSTTVQKPGRRRFCGKSLECWRFAFDVWNDLPPPLPKCLLIVKLPPPPPHHKKISKKSCELDKISKTNKKHPINLRPGHSSCLSLKISLGCSLRGPHQRSHLRQGLTWAVGMYRSYGVGFFFRCMGGSYGWHSKNMGVLPPNHPFVHRVWNHYFHYPFWGVFHPYFWKHPGLVIFWRRFFPATFRGVFFLIVFAIIRLWLKAMLIQNAFSGTITYIYFWKKNRCLFLQFSSSFQQPEIKIHELEEVSSVAGMNKGIFKRDHKGSMFQPAMFTYQRTSKSHNIRYMICLCVGCGLVPLKQWIFLTKHKL